MPDRRRRRNRGSIAPPLPALATVVALAAASAAPAWATMVRTEDQRFSWQGFLALSSGDEYGTYLSMGQAATGVGLAVVTATAGAVAQLSYSPSAGWQQTAETHPNSYQHIPVALDGSQGAFALRDAVTDLTTIYDAVTGDPLVTDLDDYVFAVAIKGDVLAIGQSNLGAGRVRIYEKTAGTWHLAKTFVGTGGEQLGASLAVGESMVVAGAPWAGPGINGVVRIYVRGAQWVLAQTIESPAISQTSAVFGRALALEGDWLAVGSPWVDRVTSLPGQLPLINVGAVYIYTPGASGWEMATLLRPPELSDNANFGTSVALHGIALAAGAWGDRAAYLYLRSGSLWQRHLRLEGSVSEFGLGKSVALGDLGVLVGNPTATVDGVQEGAVLFYKGIVPFFYDSFETGNFTAWSAKTP